jgi:hypothetical protein
LAFLAYIKEGEGRRPAFNHPCDSTHNSGMYFVQIIAHRKSAVNEIHHAELPSISSVEINVEK